MTQAGLARLLPALALAVLALSGCGGKVTMPAVPASQNGPDPTVSESPAAASTIMTCDTIETEHAGIAQSLQALGNSSAADTLRRRDAALARLAAQKGCTPF